MIIATGGMPGTGWTDGAELCTDPWDIITGAARASGRTVIFDGTGRHVGPILAEKAQDHASELTYLMVDEVMTKELAYAERVIWRKRFSEMGIRPVGEHGLQSIKTIGNALEVTCIDELTGQTKTFAADTVIADHGTLPVDDVFQELRNQSGNRGVMDTQAFMDGHPQPGLDDPGISLFRIGDAVSSRNIPAAIFDALRLCAPL